MWLRNLKQKIQPLYVLPSYSPVNLQPAMAIVIINLGKGDLSDECVTTQRWQDSNRNVDSSQCWNSWSPAPVLSHTFGKIQNLSDGTNSQIPTISPLLSWKKNNRKTPKLKMHLQWIIWSQVTSVWHNLRGIHKLFCQFQDNKLSTSTNFWLPWKPCKEQGCRIVPQFTG